MLPFAPNVVNVSRPAATTGDYEDTILTSGGEYVTENGEYVLAPDSATPTIVATGMRVAITAPAGTDLVVGGQKEIVDATMIAPPTPIIQHIDIVNEPATGDAYRVVWVRRRRGLGLDHQVVGLRAVVGGSAT